MAEGTCVTCDTSCPLGQYLAGENTSPGMCVGEVDGVLQGLGYG